MAYRTLTAAFIVGLLAAGAAQFYANHADRQQAMAMNDVQAAAGGVNPT